MSDHNHDGLHERKDGIVYDVDKIDDELGIIEKDGIRLTHDRMNGTLRIERTQIGLTEIIGELEELVDDE